MSNKLKILTEWNPWEYDKDKALTERTQNNGKIMMKGILQKSNTLNQNGRIYPKEILEER